MSRATVFERGGFEMIKVSEEEITVAFDKWQELQDAGMLDRGQMRRIIQAVLAVREAQEKKQARIDRLVDAIAINRAELRELGYI